MFNRVIFKTDSDFVAHVYMHISILSFDIIYFFEQIWDILLPLWILSTIIIIWLI